MLFFKKIFGHHRTRSTQTAARQSTVGQLESLEGRRMLAADASLVVGDSNLDGRFDSSDMVAVFSHGKFESGESASFAEGDWNSDGYFNSGDFVTAFQANTYERPSFLAADVAEGEAGNPIDVDDTDAGAGDDVNMDGQQRRGHRERPHRGREGDNGRERPSTEDRLQSFLENVQERIDAGLGEDADTGAIQAAVNTAAEALAAGDTDAAMEAIAGLRGQIAGDRRDNHERPSVEERLQNAVNGIQERIDAGDLPDGVDADAIQAAVTTAGEALATGDLDAAKKALNEVRAAHQQADIENRIQNAITNIQERIDAGGLPEGADAEAVQTAVTTAAEALAAGDLDAAKEALKGIGRQRGERDQPSPDERVQGMIDRLQTRVDEGLPEGVDPAPIQAAIDSATAALEAGNVDEAREVLAALRGQRGDGDEDRPQRDRNGRDRQDRIRERVGEIRDRVADRVQDMRAGILQHMVERIQHAIDSGNLPAGADATAIQTGVATAAAALEAGDLDAAREALNSIRPNRGERPDAEGDMDDDGEPENDADGNDQDRDQGERRTRGGRPPRGRTPRG